MATFKDMIRDVKSKIREVSVEEARARAGKGAVLIDVREPDEWANGHVPGATYIPRGFLELRVEEKVPDRSQEVVLYCAGGVRSALGAKAVGRLEVATPVVADGVIYYTASPNIALAVDARTGRELWRYTHKVAKKTALCCSMVNRGVALYRDRVFMATVDAHLVALNSRNGRVVWNRKVADPSDGYSHTIAPLVIQGLVILFAGALEHMFRPAIQTLFASLSPRAVGLAVAKGEGA